MSLPLSSALWNALNLQRAPSAKKAQFTLLSMLYCRCVVSIEFSQLTLHLFLLSIFPSDVVSFLLFNSSLNQITNKDITLLLYCYKFCFFSVVFRRISTTKVTSLYDCNGSGGCKRNKQCRRKYNYVKRNWFYTYLNEADNCENWISQEKYSIIHILLI